MIGGCRNISSFNLEIKELDDLRNDVWGEIGCRGKC